MRYDENRQEEAEALSKLCDCVIVIGGKNSSNTQNYTRYAKNCKNSMY